MQRSVTSTWAPVAPFASLERGGPWSLSLLRAIPVDTLDSVSEPLLTSSDLPALGLPSHAPISRIRIAVTRLPLASATLDLPLLRITGLCVRPLTPHIECNLYAMASSHLLKTAMAALAQGLAGAAEGSSPPVGPASNDAPTALPTSTAVTARLKASIALDRLLASWSTLHLVSPLRILHLEAMEQCARHGLLDGAFLRKWLLEGVLGAALFVKAGGAPYWNAVRSAALRFLAAALEHSPSSELLDTLVGIFVRPELALEPKRMDVRPAVNLHRVVQALAHERHTLFLLHCPRSQQLGSNSRHSPRDASPPALLQGAMQQSLCAGMLGLLTSAAWRSRGVCLKAFQRALVGLSRLAERPGSGQQLDAEAVAAGGGVEALQSALRRLDVLSHVLLLPCASTVLQPQAGQGVGAIVTDLLTWLGSHCASALLSSHPTLLLAALERVLSAALGVHALGGGGGNILSDDMLMLQQQGLLSESFRFLPQLLHLFMLQQQQQAQAQAQVGQSQQLLQDSAPPLPLPSATAALPVDANVVQALPPAPLIRRMSSSSVTDSKEGKEEQCEEPSPPPQSAQVSAATPTHTLPLFGWPVEWLPHTCTLLVSIAGEGEEEGGGRCATGAGQGPSGCACPAL